jgi:hypothetical protein
MTQTQSRSAWACAVFGIGFLLHFLPLTLHHSIAQPDEIFQAVEQAHRLVFGYGVMTWEFASGARSWILALLAAGPMMIAKTLHGGPALYLPLIAGLFAAIAAASTLCVYWRVREFYGTAGAAAAAMASACWIDNIYFGARSLSEPLAAHLLIIAICLAGPAGRRGGLILGGFLAAFAFVVRMQIAPAIALLWLWPPVNRQRFLFLSAGAVLALACDAALDAATWGMPFGPLWQNFRFNLVQNGAAHFGSNGWDSYFRAMAYNWGASAVPFLALALLGARRMPMLLAMAAAILAVHMLVGHKEFRFILPAIALLSVLAGLGLVEATRLIAYGLDRDISRPAPAWLAILVGTGWAAISLLNVIGRGYEDYWRLRSDTLAAQLKLAHMPGLCGVGFDIRILWTGGYSYLHQPVPMYTFASAMKPEDVRAANVLVADPSSPAAFSAGASYRKQQCFGTECIYLRPGGCEALPRLAPPSDGMGLVDYYTYAHQAFPQNSRTSGN